MPGNVSQNSLNFKPFKLFKLQLTPTVLLTDYLQAPEVGGRQVNRECDCEPWNVSQNPLNFKPFKLFKLQLPPTALLIDHLPAQLFHCHSFYAPRGLPEGFLRVS